MATRPTFPATRPTFPNESMTIALAAHESNIDIWVLLSSVSSVVEFWRLERLDLTYNNLASLEVDVGFFLLCAMTSTDPAGDGDGCRHPKWDGCDMSGTGVGGNVGWSSCRCRFHLNSVEEAATLLLGVERVNTACQYGISD
ncbi:hypothetical protein M8C21_010400 [Ambrosia artemisiifolia]|uniref:Uncharacterized protein n=1 Tax=Ambrosia artemisiifolia TaxID=4212 RepID=A0AAD5GJ01_AMBAR|nr:hypothetical protein M8C21_010400 [Ambrosia artemisiifolia]